MINLLYILLVCLLVGIDQGVKSWVSATIKLNTAHPWLPDLMALTNLHNRGAAWSMLNGAQVFFIVITIIALVVIFYLMYRCRHSVGEMIGLCLILAGTIGNFIDRLVHGYVIDMFELLPINFPVFNVADSCLTIGVIILIIVILREDDTDEKTTDDSKRG